MRKIAVAGLLLALGVALASHVFMNRLPGPAAMLGELGRDPVQTEITAEPFEVQREDMTYTVTPLYDYELYGFVVSTHEAGSFLDISHSRWKDHLNIKDLCVIWGDNARGGVYESLKFRSGDFTCYFRTDDRAAFMEFRQDQMSNNHLLAADEDIARAIGSARRGDQVRVAGYLAEYAHDGGFHRGTSTTRDDKGNGACETVFVTEFQILKPANRTWLHVQRAALALAGLCAVLIVVGFFKGNARVD